MTCKHKSVRWVDKDCRTTWKSFGAVTAQCVACMVNGVRSLGETPDPVDSNERLAAEVAESRWASDPDMHPHVVDKHAIQWEQGTVCSDASAFVDGELDKLDAQCFRMHLPNCADCQQLVGFVVVTEAVLSAGGKPSLIPANPESLQRAIDAGVDVNVQVVPDDHPEIMWVGPVNIDPKETP